MAAEDTTAHEGKAVSARRSRCKWSIYLLKSICWMVKSSFARMITRLPARSFAIFISQNITVQIAILTFVVMIAVRTGAPASIVATAITRVVKLIPTTKPRTSMMQVTKWIIGSASPITKQPIFLATLNSHQFAQRIICNSKTVCKKTFSVLRWNYAHNLSRDSSRSFGPKQIFWFKSPTSTPTIESSAKMVMFWFTNNVWTLQIRRYVFQEGFKTMGSWVNGQLFPTTQFRLNLWW